METPCAVPHEPDVPDDTVTAGLVPDGVRRTLGLARGPMINTGRPGLARTVRPKPSLHSGNDPHALRV